MRIIGLVGRARSGKGTAGGLLAAALADAGWTVRIDAFAVGVKHVAGRVMGYAGEKTDFWRQALQTIGLHYRCTRHEDYWIRLLINRLVERRSERPDILIVPDVRFPNEAEWILGPDRGDLDSDATRDSGAGVLIGIDGGTVLQGDLAHHASEAQIPALFRRCRYEITNDGSVDDLNDDMLHIGRELIHEWMESGT